MHLETLYISEDGVNSAGLANTVFEVACGMPATNVYDSRRRGASDTLAFCQGYSHDESSGGRVGLHLSTDTLRGATLTLSFKRVNGSPLSQLDTTVGLQWVATLLILPL